MSERKERKLNKTNVNRKKWMRERKVNWMKEKH